MGDIPVILNIPVDTGAWVGARPIFIVNIFFFAIAAGLKGFGLKPNPPKRVYIIEHELTLANNDRRIRITRMSI